MDENYDKALKSMRTELFRWTRKRLSIQGKVNVIKTYALSKFTHIAAILPNPGKEIAIKIESSITRFIARNRSIVPKDLIFLLRLEGGLGVPRITTFWGTIKLAWLKRIYTSDAFWTKILNEGLPSGKINELMCYSPQTYEQTLRSGCNKFWIEVSIMMASIMRAYYNQNFDNILQQNINLNSHLTLDQNIYFKNHPYLTLGALVDNDINFLSMESLT